MNEIQKFTFYRNYYDLIKELKPSEKVKFLEAIVYYVFEDKEPGFKGLNNSIWQIIKVALDTSKNRSNNHKKKNSNEFQNDFKNNSNEIQNNFSEAISISTSISNISNIDNNLFSYIEETLGRLLSPVEYELVSNWEDNEVTRHAVKQTALQRATSLKYTQGILNSYKAKGLTTLEDIEADEKKFNEQKTKKTNPFKTQKDKDKEFIAKMREELKNEQG